MDYTACQTPLSFTISHSLRRFMSIESVMPSSHLILCHLLLLPSIFPASGSFPVSGLFASGGQSIGASASVLPMNIQGWFPLGLTSLSSMKSTGFSRVFCTTTNQKHQFFGAQPSYGPTLTQGIVNNWYFLTNANEQDWAWKILGSDNWGGIPHHSHAYSVTCDNDT